jgi:large subunit ribosomal protein L25
METITLQAEARTPGKTTSKQIRREERVPCVLYGPHAEPVHFSVGILDLRPLIYTNEQHRVEVKVDGESYDCLLKTVDFHPTRDVPTHADFLALTAGEMVTVTVPLSLVGTAPGVKAGGIRATPLNELEVSCLPKDIPGHIDVDISELEIGDAIHVSDLDLGDLVVLTDPARTIVTITAPRAEEVEETEEDELAGEALDLVGDEETPDGEADDAEEA